MATAQSSSTNLESSIVLRGVTKEFGTGETRTIALADVSLDLPYGELVLLVGPSGCGKTTLISVIAGLLDATRGEVEVLFAASLDRAWFRSPKLRQGTRGILLLFRIDEDERPPREMPRNGWQALNPLDLQPVERRKEIERLVAGDMGGR